MIPQLPRGLYVVADPRFLPTGMDIVAYVSALARYGAPAIQLRMKDVVSEIVMETAQRISRIRDKHPFFFVVNDCPEIAHAVRADAVHVGKADAAVVHAREIVGPDVAIGYSSHVLNEAVAAAEAGADYVAFGAIFPTTTKEPGHPVQDLKKLRAVTEAVTRPVVAIGGINRSNAIDVWTCGVHALAMITGISRAPDLETEVNYYKSLLVAGKSRIGSGNQQPT